MTTTIDRDKPCEDRIDNELEQTEQHFADLYAQIDAVPADDPKRYEELHDRLDPLSAEVVHTMRLMFRCGGPADWIDVELMQFDEYWFEATSMVYHYADGFDHAEREVMPHEAPALWRLAEYFAESV